MNFLKKLVLCILLPILIIGIIKFDVIWNTFYQPEDLKLGYDYVNRVITLGREDIGTCSAKSRKARQETLAIYAVLDSIVNAHQKDPRYDTIKNILQNFLSSTPVNPMCKQGTSDENNKKISVL